MINLRTMSLGPIFKTKQKITQKFGNVLKIGGNDFYAQYGLKGHNGIDYGTVVGTEVLSPFDGILTVVSDSPAYGKYVKVTKTRPDGKSEAIFAHLSWAKGKTGDSVKAGEAIALTGGAKGSPGAGSSTGPHLHFGLRFLDVRGNVVCAGNGFSGYVDPQPYFA